MNDEYIFKLLKANQIEAFILERGIEKEKVLLLNNFTLKLVTYIYNTYLGLDIIVSKKQKENHYKWCFDKAVESFLTENNNVLMQNGNDELYKYFREYYAIFLYDRENEDEVLNCLSDELMVWEKNLNLSLGKTQLDLDTLASMYHIFNKSFIVVDNCEN